MSSVDERLIQDDEVTKKGSYARRLSAAFTADCVPVPASLCEAFRAPQRWSVDRYYTSAERNGQKAVSGRRHCHKLLGQPSRQHHWVVVSGVESPGEIHLQTKSAAEYRSNLFCAVSQRSAQAGKSAVTRSALHTPSPSHASTFSRQARHVAARTDALARCNPTLDRPRRAHRRLRRVRAAARSLDRSSPRRTPRRPAHGRQRRDRRDQRAAALLCLEGETSGAREERVRLTDVYNAGTTPVRRCSCSSATSSVEWSSRG